MCLGEDPDGIHQDEPAPKSIGHVKVMPPDIQDSEVTRIWLPRMLDRMQAALRPADR